MRVIKGGKLTTVEIADKMGVSVSEVKKEINLFKEELIESGMNYSEKLETYIFSKRAIMNISMLLGNSIAAKNVRIDILKHSESLNNKEKEFLVNEEQKLLLDIATSKNRRELEEALFNYDGYKNKYSDTKKERLN